MDLAVDIPTCTHLPGNYACMNTMSECRLGETSRMEQAEVLELPTAILSAVRGGAAAQTGWDLRVPLILLASLYTSAPLCLCAGPVLDAQRLERV